LAIYNDYTQPETQIERSVRLLPPPSEAETQSKRMLKALGILLLALVAVIFRVWDFCFPSHADSPDVSARKV
jgi:hypothetical protein